MQAGSACETCSSRESNVAAGVDTSSAAIAVAKESLQQNIDMYQRLADLGPMRAGNCNFLCQDINEFMREAQASGKVLALFPSAGFGSV